MDAFILPPAVPLCLIVQPSQVSSSALLDKTTPMRPQMPNSYAKAMPNAFHSKGVQVHIMGVILRASHAIMPSGSSSSTSSSICSMASLM